MVRRFQIIGHYPLSMVAISTNSGYNECRPDPGHGPAGPLPRAPCLEGAQWPIGYEESRIQSEPRIPRRQARNPGVTHQPLNHQPPKTSRWLKMESIKI